MKYDSVKIEAKVSGTWTDISEYVNMNSVLSWTRGIFGNGVRDRIARPGSISLSLYDTTGQFDPINSSAILSSGTEIRYYVELDGVGRYLWYGKIKEASPREDDLYKQFAQVGDRDWET